MKALIELNPGWCTPLTSFPEKTGEGMSFDCPACGPRHRLTVWFANPLHNGAPSRRHLPVWQRTGEKFEVLTLEPSIDYPCWHGWIENGQVIGVNEAPLVLLGPDRFGNPVPTALSPMQCVKLAHEILEKYQTPKVTQ